MEGTVSRPGGEWSEPIRCRVFDIKEGGDFSLKRSSRVRVLGLE